MNKIILAFGLSLANIAIASPISKCSPGVITIINDGKDAWIEADWTQPASFPTPSRTFRIDGLNKNISIACPNFTANFDAKSNTYTFIGKTFRDIFSYSGLISTRGPSYIELYMDLDSGYSNASIDVSEYDGTFSFHATGTFEPPSYLVVYKIDGGKRQPLYFDGKEYKLNVPKNAKLLEIFAPGGQYARWQYMSINFKSNTLVLKQKSIFPIK